MSLLEHLEHKIGQKQIRLRDLYRQLHRRPELSFQEEETARFIADFYRHLPYDGLETDVGGSKGLVVSIKGAHDGPCIGLRADFDALPIQEESGLDFASEIPGVMHACGHDGHTAYMLILAESLIELKDELHGTVKIIHQAAEEMPPGGALSILQSGFIDGLDAIFGIHLLSNLPSGHVYYHAGNTQTGRSHFKLHIQGKGGHGSSPHLCNDAIVAGAAFVMNLQTIVSRRINPFDTAVVTIGSFDGAGQFNIIKDAVVLEGDVRSMSEEARAVVEAQLRQMVVGLDLTYGVTTTLDYAVDYPVLYNDPQITARVAAALRASKAPEIIGVEEIAPQPPSEDFAYYLEKIPGCYFYVGAMPEDGVWYPHHHPKFKINEASLSVAAHAMAAVVAAYCGAGDA